MSRKTTISIGAALSVVLLAIALFDWNVLRGPIARYVSYKLDRQFVINGDLQIKLSNPIQIQAKDVVLANAPWSTDANMAEAHEVTLQVDARELFSRHVVLPEISLVKPTLRLERNAAGTGNWEFPGWSRGRGPPLTIGALWIDDGMLHYRDPELGADLAMAIASERSAAVGTQSTIRFRGQGRLRMEPFRLDGTGDTPLSLRESGKPYRLQVRAAAGATRVKFDGRFLPFEFKGIDGRLDVQGDDLSQLYPIVPIPLPWTPPYQVAGRLVRETDAWSFHQFSGRVGNSDVAGEFSVDRSGKRPVVVADVVSRRLNYKDLGGLVGVPPGTTPLSEGAPEQRQEAARRAASAKVLPTKPYNLAGFRRVDADIRFRGEQFTGYELPLDSLNVHFDLKDGQLKLQPLDFGVAGGHVTSNLALDVRGPTMLTNAQVTVRNVELKDIIPNLKPPKGNAGKIAGSAKFSSTGNSVAEILGSMNGEIALITWGGKASTLALVLTNLDLANAASLLLRGDEASDIRCIVADFAASGGKMVTNTLVVDTSAENIVGDGSIDFRNELYDLRLKAKSKHASLVALRGPIEIGGTFKKPRVAPQTGPVAVRAGTAIALGVIATPIAALLPLIDLGAGVDSDCSAAIADAKENAAKRPSAR